MTENITLLRTDATQQSLPFPTNLEGWQSLVGGYIEIIERPGLILIVNEEGLIQELAPNVQASLLIGQPIVGDAILLQGKAITRFQKEDEV